MACVKDVVSAYLDKDQVEKFAEWAFGEEYLILEGLEKFMEEWNKRHSDKFALTADGSIAIDLKKMVNIWKESLK